MSVSLRVQRIQKRHGTLQFPRKNLQEKRNARQQYYVKKLHRRLLLSRIVRPFNFVILPVDQYDFKTLFCSNLLNCAILDCPEWLGGNRINSSCYRTYDLNKCCSTGFQCGKNLDMRRYKN